MRVTKEELREIVAPLIKQFRAYVDERVQAGALALDVKMAAYLAAIPVPRDGKDADPEMIRLATAEILPAMVDKAQKMLAERLDRWTAAFPLPKDGAPGKDADPEVVRALVAKAVSEIPAPQDGAPGKDGEPGKDGSSVALEDVLPQLEAGFSRWALDFERRAADVLQRAAERIPKPKDGVDGMSIEDLTVEDDGDGRVTFRFARGEVSREFTIRLPRFRDLGVYREGQAHQKGDGVTFGGSFWIAQKDDPPGKPGDPDSGWRLAVKKGRDGKDGGGSPAASRGPVRVG